SAASKAAVLRASTSLAACWRRSAFRPVRITLAPSARARRAVSNPMPALPPITTTVCPRSSGSRWMGGGVTVLIVPPIRLVYFSLHYQQFESDARAFLGPSQRKSEKSPADFSDEARNASPGARI